MQCKVVLGREGSVWGANLFVLSDELLLLTS